jgi:hypothetical protein
MKLGRAPRVEGGPGAQVLSKLPEPVLHLGAHGEGAMNAVGAVGRCLVFAAPDAHVKGETGQPPRRLRLERLVETGLPPGIRLRGPAGRQGRRDRGLHRGHLGGNELDIHESQIIGARNALTHSRDFAQLSRFHPFG